VHVQHVVAIRSLLRHEAERTEKCRIIQAAARERFARSQARLEAGKVVSAGPDQLDVGIERHIQGRFEMDIP
jgi:hypothetical protein